MCHRVISIGSMTYDCVSQNIDGLCSELLHKTVSAMKYVPLLGSVLGELTG